MKQNPFLGIHFRLACSLCVLLLAACAPSPAPSAAPEASTPTQALPTATLTPPTPTAAAQGRTRLVTSPADSGPGTLRQALIDAQPYDTITFDPNIFPPDNPTTISITSDLPSIHQGNLAIDASNSGVIINGSGDSGPEAGTGLSITSDHNTVKGLQIVGFSDVGIGLGEGAQDNTIGGDRGVGQGPLGQGNLISGNGNFGIGLWGEDTSHNTVQGNYIGINMDGTETWGHSRDGVHSNGATQNVIIDNVIAGNESAGVYLCCVPEGKNTVMDNLIGVGPNGIPLGNQLGVLIDRSHYNVVGPGNVIAQNIGDGVSFWEDTPNNTVTRNIIHDNGYRGIAFSPGQTTIQPPLVINFDKKAGMLTGFACANCTVEIFSDSSDEGGIYEGRTEAEEDGAFTFAKGASFTGPFLTTTATDLDESTSEFSPPTQGTSQNLSLQVGNTFPIFRLQTRPSNELADNRIGGDWGAVSPAVDVGLKWIRLSVDPSGQWQQVNWERDEYTIDPQEEQYIDDLRSNGMRIMLVLDISEPTPKLVLKAEEGVQQYLNWVRFIARHFKGRIEYYEILNEPSFDFEAPSGMPLDVYLNLIQRTVPIIWEEDPQAKIVVGALPDTRWADVRNYMWGLLNSEIMPLVDRFSWHGMYGAAPSDDPRGIRDAGQMENYWENYPALVVEIKRVAASAGFKGEYFVEEMLWRTPAAWLHPDEPDGFTDISGAKYSARAIIIHLGLNVLTGLSGFPEDFRPQSYSVVQALCTVMAGSQPTEIAVVIESDASNIKYYGFTLSNGDRLVAVWTDGAAVEYDPGVISTLTFPGTSTQKVIGVDVLHGFEQELIIEMENGNLVISDFLIKDYPIILRLIE